MSTGLLEGEEVGLKRNLPFNPTVMPKESPCWFTSIGMFIIDDNKYPPNSNKKTEKDIIGGALTYAVAGARMVATIKNGDKVGGIIDKGSDFPDHVEHTIKSWGTGMVFRSDPTRKTTRGVNVYLENGIRQFYYETPKKRIDVFDIMQYDKLLHSKSFHLICSIDRCKDIIQVLNQNLPSESKPMILWEPFPDDCIPENFEKLKEVLPMVDVFTPNLIEAQNYLSKTEIEISTDLIPSLIDNFLPYMSKNAVVALRCGERGCYVKSIGNQTNCLVPAYHTDQSLVIDPTGGGNLFCGGFMVGYLLSKNWISAAICGNLVSGCVIEGLGVPNLEDGDKWNGLDMKERLRRYNEKYVHFSKEVNLIDWL